MNTHRKPPARKPRRRLAWLAGSLLTIFLLGFLSFSTYRSWQDDRFVLLHGDIETIQDLLDSGLDVNSRGEGGMTPLHSAVTRADKALVALLLEHGADVNIRDDSSQTPLYLAASKLDTTIAKILLENGADANIKGNGNDTPIDAVYMFHDSRESERMVELLRLHGGVSQYDE